MTKDRMVVAQTKSDIQDVQNAISNARGIIDEAEHARLRGVNHLG